MKFLAKVQEFDKNKFHLILDLIFVDEETVTDILKLKELSVSKYLTFTVKESSKRNPITDQQRKKWFVDVSKILEHEKVPLTSETISALHYDLKLSYFPCQFVKIGEKEIPIPSSINHLTLEQLNNAIHKLELDYSSMGIKFDGI